MGLGKRCNASHDTAKKYCERTTHAFAHAKLAYQDTVSDDCTLLTDRLTDAQAVCTVTGRGLATIAFRGTTSVSDWVHNSRVMPAPAPAPCQGMIHRGFLAQYTSLHSRILDFLRTNEVTRVMLCGHSLGGALATIACALLPLDISRDLVTFGAPKAGNKKFSEYTLAICGTCYRIVVDRDVVPTLPFAYNHVTDAFHEVDDDGNVTYRSKSQSLAARAIQRIRGVFKLDIGIADHALSRYAKGCPPIA
jgi:predicted lipase